MLCEVEHVKRVQKIYTNHHQSLTTVKTNFQITFRFSVKTISEEELCEITYLSISRNIHSLLEKNSVKSIYEFPRSNEHEQIEN